MSAEIPLYAVVDKSKKTVKSPAGGDDMKSQITPDNSTPSVNIPDTNDTDSLHLPLPDAIVADSPHLLLPDTSATDIDGPHLSADNTNLKKPPPVEPYQGEVSSSTYEKSETKNVYETIPLAKAVKKEDSPSACLPKYLGIFTLAAIITVVFIIVFVIVSLIAITANSSVKSEIAVLQSELAMLQQNLSQVSGGIENTVASLEANFEDLGHNYTSLFSSTGHTSEELRQNYSRVLSFLDRNSEELLELGQNVSQLLNALVNELRLNHSQLQNLIEVQELHIVELRGNYSNLDSEFQQLNVEFECPLLIISCADLPPSCPSGYYWVRVSNGSVVRVYCDMTLSCGNITGGWMRVAELNMTDTSQQCPGNLVERKDSESGIRQCRSPGNTCYSMEYCTADVSYLNVCGRITAYQVGSTNAFHNYYEHQSTTTINSTYVDGVSLTYGIPREHIWTFAAALDRGNGNQNTHSLCPCQSNMTPPPFVGEDYFCDAGDEEFMTGETGLQTDSLWDETDCLCCDNPPWFYKQLPHPTTDDIEMRVCKNENDENIAITEFKIYVQ